MRGFELSSSNTNLTLVGGVFQIFWTLAKRARMDETRCDIISSSRGVGLIVLGGIAILGKVRYVFFDACFTLIRPDPSFEDACQSLLAELGIPYSRQRLDLALTAAERVIETIEKHSPQLYAEDERIRLAWARSFAVLLEHLAERSSQSWLRLGFQIYDSYHPSSRWKAYDDVKPTLRQLRDLGIGSVVVSDFGKELPEILSLIGLREYFDAVVVSSIAGIAKPSAELYRLALESVSAKVDQVIMVGDNYLADIVGAKEAGISGYLLVRSKGAVDTPKAAGVISDLQEIVDLARAG